MLTYITDQKHGEPDILSPVKHDTLIIKVLDGIELYRQPAPEGGWTHDQLSAMQPDQIEKGAEAYLGARWVGSTEV